ncbi:MAG: hypothetical protein HC778_00470 [Chamaesiphon sp. CSU_1_12]|nr:hypothetical protein [Chamaesiphon sp. CSU_1_12]
MQIAQEFALTIERPIRECLGSAYAYRYEKDRQITDLSTAQEHFQFALAMARASKDRLAEQAILGNLVNFYLIQQSLDMAIECGLQAIDLHQYFDNPLEHSNALGNLGAVYCQKGQELQQIGDNLEAEEQINRGIEYLLKSLNISVDLDELSNQVWMHCNIAEAYSISARIEKGKEHLDLAETTIKKINPSDVRLEQRLQSLQEQFKNI